jgi:hypothetical protein
MSTKNHEITSESGKALLKQLRDWLPGAGFAKDNNGNRKYNQDERLDAKVMPLLKDLGLHVCRNATGPSSCLIDTFQNLGYTVWRISNRITIHNTTGPGYLIPILEISGNPSLTPGGPQKAGWYTYIPVDTDLVPELDCIFVVPMKQ